MIVIRFAFGDFGEGSECASTDMTVIYICVCVRDMYIYIYIYLCVYLFIYQC
jgi:hypothetical protein